MPKRPDSTVLKRRKPKLSPEVTHLDYKDVALLRTFISDRGKIRARRVTGLNPQQQRAVTRAIKNARELAPPPYANQKSQPSGATPSRSATRSDRSRTSPAPRSSAAGVASTSSTS